MPSHDDMELLREYVARDSQTAFEELLKRHVNLVYSTALRLVREPALAGEVTQTAFIILSRKAHTLRSGTILSGWLYRTTQFAAARALRTEMRRRQREQEAVKMQTEPSNPNSIWEELSPLLDEAMGKLGEAERNAVVLRYFENKTSRDVGAALGVNEAAAQKRVARAVEKLRGYCLKRGLAASVVGLTALISANAVQAAPASVVAGTATALKATGGAATTAALVKGTLTLMRWAKIKFALITGLGVTAVTGAVILAASAQGPQPQFGGQRLNSWLARLDDGDRQDSHEMKWVSWQEILASRTSEQKEAAAAIQAMGDAALPYLHEALSKQDGKLDHIKQKVGLKEPPEARRHRAMLALDALGPAARPLLPQLAECLEGTNCPKEAAMALAAIGPDGWAVLAKGVLSTNNYATPCSIWALGTHRAGGREAVAVLKYTLTNGISPYLSGEAAWALAEIGEDRKELVGLLMEGLKSKKEDLRWPCALALGELGPDARAAIPALVEALKDASERVRHDATQALQEIDPGAAALAGAGEPLAQRHIPRTRVF